MSLRRSRYFASPSFRTRNACGSLHSFGSSHSLEQSSAVRLLALRRLALLRQAQSIRSMCQRTEVAQTTQALDCLVAVAKMGGTSVADEQFINADIAPRRGVVRASMTIVSRLIANFSWPIYCRSYLVTLGAILVGLGCLIVARQSGGIGSLSPGYQLALGLALLIGMLLVLAGLLGSSRLIEGWADAWSRHEIALVLMLLAVPLYLVLVPIYRRRGRL